MRFEAKVCENFRERSLSEVLYVVAKLDNVEIVITAEGVYARDEQGKQDVLWSRGAKTANVTKKAQEALDLAKDNLDWFLDRHKKDDWGIVTEYVKHRNKLAKASADWVYSRYTTKLGHDIVIKSHPLHGILVMVGEEN